jgi:hypothetical protein
MDQLFNAAVELITDVKAPQPGEELYCPRMRALRGAALEIAKTLLAPSGQSGISAFTSALGGPSRLDILSQRFSESDPQQTSHLIACHVRARHLDRRRSAPKLGFLHKDLDQYFGGHFPGKRGCLA